MIARVARGSVGCAIAVASFFVYAPTRTYSYTPAVSHALSGVVTGALHRHAGDNAVRFRVRESNGANLSVIYRGWVPTRLRSGRSVELFGRFAASQTVIYPVEISTLRVNDGLNALPGG